MKWMGLLLALASCSKGGAGATTGGLSSPDGGVQLLPGEKCGPDALCSGTANKTYKRCMAAGPPCTVRYITSDAQIFSCAGCNDCSAANGLVAGWCGPGDEKCKDEPTRNDCLTCCDMAHQSGSAMYTMLFQQCLCDSPGECAIDCANDFCDTGMIADFFCQFCIQGSTCDPTNKCKMDSDCSAFIDCADTCPAT